MSIYPLTRNEWTGEVELALSPEDVFELCEMVANSEDSDPDAEWHVPTPFRVCNNIAAQYWDDPVHVVVYDVGQGYGGPEEGGWWYTTYEVLRTFEVNTGSVASNARIARAIAECVRAANPPEGTFGSYGGWDHKAVVIEQTETPGHLADQRRPTYA